MDILINMCAESKPNKEVFCQNSNAVGYLLSLLNMQYEQGNDKENKSREDLQETVLRLLRILCHDHGYMIEVQGMLMERLFFLYNMLQTMRPKLIWRTLQVAIIIQVYEYFSSSIV